MEDVRSHLKTIARLLRSPLAKTMMPLLPKFVIVFVKLLDKASFFVICVHHLLVVTAINITYVQCYPICRNCYLLAIIFKVFNASKVLCFKTCCASSNFLAWNRLLAVRVVHKIALTFFCGLSWTLVEKGSVYF